MLLFFAINFQAVDNNCPKGPHRDNWQHNHHKDVNSNLWTSLILVEKRAQSAAENLLNSDTVKAAGGGVGVGVGKLAAGARAGPNGLPGAIQVAGGFDGIGLA